jgi:hypothetical protein
MIIEATVFWIFIIECWFALWAGKASVKLETIKEQLDALDENAYEEINNLKTKVGVIKTIQSKVDKLEDKINKSAEPKTDCACSSTENKYTKSEIDAKFDELYELLGIEKEDYVDKGERETVYTPWGFWYTSAQKQIKQRLVFKKKSKKK